MRFTKVLAAAIAAMAIVSCSEQVTDFGENIQPGDAVLSFKVGTSGGTTYATTAEEDAVNSLTAFLKYQDGNNQPAFMKLTATKSGVNQTLPDGSFTAGAATLYLVANKDVTANTETELLAINDNKVIYTYAGGELKLDATGMTATRKLDINLKSGPVNTGTIDGTAITSNEVTLKRLAARVYASSTNTATPKDIAGYKVDFAGTTSEANLFTYLGSGVGTAPTQYILKGDGTGQHGTSEAVGYVYQSATDVTITVTHPSDAAVTKEIKFKPTANKNYKLLITPSSGATLDFTVKLEEYENLDLGNVDFGKIVKKAHTDALTVPAGVTATGSTITVDSYSDFSTGTDIDLADLAYDDGAGNGVGFKSIDKIDVASVTTRAIDASNYLKVTTTGTKITVKAVPNTSGNDISVKLTVSGKGDDIENLNETITVSFDVVIPTIAANLLEAMDEATVEMKGVKWVMFGTDSDLQKDLQRALDIKNAGGFNTATIKSNKDKFLNTKSVGASTTCPKGYRQPSMDDFYALLGEHRSEIGAGTSGKWLATVGTTKTFTSGVVGKAEFFDTANDLAIYSFTDGGKTLWITGNKGYITSTSPDGKIAGIAANPNAILRIAPWHDGIAYNSILKTDSASTNDLRCVVDEDYKGLN